MSTQNTEEIWQDSGNGFKQCALAVLKYIDVELFNELTALTEKSLIKDGIRYGKREITNKDGSKTIVAWKKSADVAGGKKFTPFQRKPKRVREIKILSIDEFNNEIKANEEAYKTADYEVAKIIENLTHPENSLVIIYLYFKEG